MAISLINEVPPVLDDSGFRIQRIDFLIHHLGTLPIGQRDIVDSQIHPGIFCLIPLGYWCPGWWFWLVLLFIMGYRHPVIHDDARALGTLRRHLAWPTIVIFLMTFVPAPFTFN
jgi:hypothetical protein